MSEISQAGSEPHRELPIEPPRWDKMYFSELDEVYLLLDFIAGRPDRNVSALEVDVSMEVDDTDAPGKQASEKRTLRAPEIVKAISRLRFPQGTPTQ